MPPPKPLSSEKLDAGGLCPPPLSLLLPLPMSLLYTRSRPRARRVPCLL
jgi:hypothetical protein